MMKRIAFPGMSFRGHSLFMGVFSDIDVILTQLYELLASDQNASPTLTMSFPVSRNEFH